MLLCVATMAFELDRFVKEPDARQLLGCTKKDLRSIAEHYGFVILGNLKKKELHSEIVNELI